MRQSLTRRTLSAIALVASIVVASLTLSVAAFAQDTTTTDPVSPYTPTSTTPTVEPTVDTLPETTETNPPPPPTSTVKPTVTSDAVPPPPTAAPAPTATTAAQPNTPPKRLAFTGYDPLIVGFAGLALMLGAVALQRRRGTR